MTSTAPTRPTFSDEELARLLAVMKASDSVELKLTVPEAVHRSTVVSLDSRPISIMYLGGWSCNFDAGILSLGQSRMSGALRLRLSALMFLQYAALGSWCVTFPSLLRALPNDGGLNLSGQIQPADRKSTRLNSSHIQKSRMPSSA